MRKVIYYSYSNNKICCIENVNGKDVSSFDWGGTYNFLRSNFKGYKFIKLETV